MQAILFCFVEPKIIYYVLLYLFFFCVRRDSSVGTATRYGLDGPGIDSRWGGEIFCTRPDRPCGPPCLLLYNGYRVSFPGVKRPGRAVTPLPHVVSRLEKG